jgi:hypothetical protein
MWLIRRALPALAILVAIRAEAGQLQITPSSVDFGNTPLVGPPRSVIVRLRNLGSATTIFGFESSLSCAEFGATAPGLPVALLDGDSLLVTVTYAPVNRGPDVCAFRIHDDNGVTDLIGATGAGRAPKLLVYETNLYFTTQTMATGVPETIWVNVENQGNQTIEDSHVTREFLTGIHFSLGAITPIPAGTVGQLPVIFHPTSPGFQPDELTVGLDNDSPSDSDWKVGMHGTWTDGSTGVGENSDAPGGLAIGPSPTRGSVEVRCAIPRAGRVALEVRDLAGRIIARSERTSAATSRGAFRLRRGVDWSPAPGVYLVRVTLDEATLGRGRVVVVR